MLMLIAKEVIFCVGGTRNLLQLLYNIQEKTKKNQLHCNNTHISLWCLIPPWLFLYFCHFLLFPSPKCFSFLVYDDRGKEEEMVLVHRKKYSAVAVMMLMRTTRRTSEETKTTIYIESVCSWESNNRAVAPGVGDGIIASFLSLFPWSIIAWRLSLCIPFLTKLFRLYTSTMFLYGS